MCGRVCVRERVGACVCVRAHFNGDGTLGDPALVLQGTVNKDGPGQVPTGVCRVHTPPNLLLTLVGVEEEPGSNHTWTPSGARHFNFKMAE